MHTYCKSILRYLEPIQHYFQNLILLLVFSWSFHWFQHRRALLVHPSNTLEQTLVKMAGEASFRNHMDMISLNEPITRKAKFWQSYVRALKGTDDMRADDSTHRRPASRALSEFPDFFGGSSSREPSARIFAPGYRYLPVHREIYGYTPRKLYGYENPSRYVPRAASLPPLTTEKGANDLQVPEWLSQNPDYFYPKKYPKSYYQPAPWTNATAPDDRFGFGSKPYKAMLNPSPHLPISSVTRDPWWHAAGLKPLEHVPRDVLRYPSALRDSFLSPVKNSFVWTNHPMRYI